MPYTYDPIFAADPNNPAMVAKDAAITIFDPAVPGVPVTITDPTGSPLPNPITVNAAGFGPAFQHATLDRVGWSGGGFSNFLTSYEGMKEVATEAKAAAEAAQGSAATAGANAASAASAALSGAVADAEAAQAAAQAAAALVNAPADAAIEAAILGSGTKTKAALNTTIGEQISAAISEIPAPEATFTTSAWQVGGTPPVYPRMTTITTFGSSSVSGLAAALPTTFTPLGVSVVNRGTSGERWEHTLARNGIVPARITFPANTVQASGAATVTTTLPTTFALLTYRGKLSGTDVIGTLGLTGGVFTFTRETAGTAFALTGPVDFIPMPTNAAGVPLNPSYRDTMAILDLGKNNADDPYTADAINAAMDSLVNWLVPMVKRYLILGLFANTGSNAAHKANIAAVNAHRAALGGDKYLDIQGYVTGSDVWTHTGLTATAGDLAQQAAGEKPDSLSVDSAHLTSVAWNAFIKYVIVPKLKAFGWYTFPDITAGLRAVWSASSLSLADGADVTSWTSDVAGGDALNAKTGAGYSWPKYRPTGGPGGTRPSVEFDRELYSHITSGTVSPARTQPWTWLALVKTSVGGQVIGGSTSSLRMKGTATDWITAGNTGPVNPDGPNGNWQIVVMSINGATGSYTVDDNRVDGAYSTAGQINRVVVGGVVSGTTGFEADFLDGHIAELREWGRALSNAEVAAAVADVRQRYGL